MDCLYPDGVDLEEVAKDTLDPLRPSLSDFKPQNVPAGVIPHYVPEDGLGDDTEARERQTLEDLVQYD